MLELRDLIFYGIDREKHGIKLGYQKKYVICNLHPDMMYQATISVKMPDNTWEDDETVGGAVADHDAVPTGRFRIWCETAVTNPFTFLSSASILASGCWLALERTSQIKRLSILFQMFPALLLMMLAALVCLSPSCTARRLRHPKLKSLVFDCVIALVALVVILAWTLGPMLSFATGMSNMGHLVAGRRGLAASIGGDDVGLGGSEVVALASHVGVEMNLSEGEKMLREVWIENCYRQNTPKVAETKCVRSNVPLELPAEYFSGVERKLHALQHEQSLLVQITSKLKMMGMMVTGGGDGGEAAGGGGGGGGGEEGALNLL